LSVLTISKSCLSFSAVRWLAKVVSKAASREVTTILCVTGEKGYATDNKRLHIADGVGIADGTYKILKNTEQEVTLETCDITPPLYNTVIPEPDELSEPLKVTPCFGSHGIQAGVIVLAFARSSPPEVNVDLDCLLDALDIGKPTSGTFYFRWTLTGSHRILVIDYASSYGARRAVLSVLSEVYSC
jgi:hypothetical protein